MLPCAGATTSPTRAAARAGASGLPVAEVRRLGEPVPGWRVRSSCGPSHMTVSCTSPGAPTVFPSGVRRRVEHTWWVASIEADQFTFVPTTPCSGR